MKSHFLILPALIFTACATAPRLNCDEACAMQNMVCVGQTLTDGSSSAINLRNGALVGGNSSSTSYQCSKDASKAAQINSFKTQAIAKADASDKKSPCFGIMNPFDRETCEKKLSSCPPAIRSNEPQNCYKWEH